MATVFESVVVPAHNISSCESIVNGAKSQGTVIFSREVVLLT